MTNADINQADDVLVVVFAEAWKAREALDVLEQLHADAVVELRAAAVVSRAESGQLDVIEEDDHTALAGAAKGGAIGVLAGAIAGPFGMLLGSGAGALLGGPSDAHRAHEHLDALTVLSEAVPPGSTAVVATVSEPQPELVDRALEPLGGAVTRRQANPM